MNSTAVVEATQALRARGVDQADQLLELAEPDQIVAACHRFDARSNRVGPGWLVSEIRAGHFVDPEPPPPPPTTAEQLQVKFADTLRRLPVGTAIERHADAESRLWNRDHECPGVLRVAESIYPTLTIVCSVCLFDAAIPVADLHRVKPMSPHNDPDDPF